jgi:3-isopropylmalate/(R)-2-methylmalate dehydratase small subunit
VLNQEQYQGAKVILAGDNFGCGSSREHAPWALVDWGFRAMISTSFADIFSNNALKNGLLPIRVDKAIHVKLCAELDNDPIAEVTVDLRTETLTLPLGTAVSFSVDPFAKKCLLAGTDQLDYLQSFDDKIREYEAQLDV